VMITEAAAQPLAVKVVNQWQALLPR
jgi:hypothetical protein